ncbi:hypothetical protein [Streptomyces sp. NPDC048637]|uniref:scabin-related ADP-ribosyltransferase n=1 Tax=Streptomyces sp. NPDC048637 TaxID=3155636 RepID=UPI00342C8A4C
MATLLQGDGFADPAPPGAAPAAQAPPKVGDSADPRVKTITYRSYPSFKVYELRPGIAVLPGPGPFDDWGDFLDAWPVLDTDAVQQAFLDRIEQRLRVIEKTAVGRERIRRLGAAVPLSTDRFGLPEGGYSDINAVVAMTDKSRPGAWTQGIALKKSPSGSDGRGTVSWVMARDDDTIARFYTAEGKEYGHTQSSTLFHELGHAEHNLCGCFDERKVQYSIPDPFNQGAHDPHRGPDGRRLVTTTAEELTTHGGLYGMTAAHGGEVSPSNNPGAFLAHAPEAWKKSFLYAKKELRGLAVTDPRYMEVSDALALRWDVVTKEPVTDIAYALEADIPMRADYHFPVPDGVTQRNGAWLPKDGVSEGELTREDLENPSTSLRPGPAPDQAPAPDPAPDPQKESTDCVVQNYCAPRPAEREMTAEEREQADRLQEAISGGKARQAPAMEAAGVKMAPEELAALARVHVREMVRSGGSFEPSLKAALAEPGQVLLTAPKTAGKLNELTRSLREAGQGLVEDPAFVVQAIAGIITAATDDGTALDKATEVLAPVPVVNSILGIADDVVDGRSGVDIAVNTINLLAGVSAVAGQPELAMLFSVVSVFVSVIGQIVAAGGAFDAEIARRDEAWTKLMPAHIRDTLIPALVTSVDELFQRYQRRVVDDAMLSIAAIDAAAAVHPKDATVQQKAAESKRTLREAVNTRVAKARTTFVNGLNPMIDKTVNEVNTDESFREFNRQYMDANRKRIREWAAKDAHSCENVVTKSGESPCGQDPDFEARADRTVDLVATKLNESKPQPIDATPLHATAMKVIENKKLFRPFHLGDSVEPLTTRSVMGPLASARTDEPDHLKPFVDAQGTDDKGKVVPVGRARTLQEEGTGYKLTDQQESLWRWDSRDPGVLFKWGIGGYQSETPFAMVGPYKNATWDLLQYTHTGANPDVKDARFKLFSTSRSVRVNGVESVWTPESSEDRWLYEVHMPGGIDFAKSMAGRTIQDRHEILSALPISVHFIRAARLIDKNGKIVRIVTNPNFTPPPVEDGPLPDLQCGTTAPVDTWDGTWHASGAYDFDHYYSATGKLQPLDGGCGNSAGTD